MNKNVESEILEIYNDYLNSYFKGDIQQFSSFIDEGFRVIGTSEIEVFNSKRETLKFYEESKDEIAHKTELRNRHIEVVPVDKLMLVQEISDFYILINGEWNFYSKVRISTFFIQTSSGWKLINQHGSLPDTKTQGGETVAFEKISKENQELRDAVKRRTIELEQKNNELELESALERVRTVAMSMQKPDDLSTIGRTIFNDLSSLGFDGIRNTEIIINKDDKEAVTTYHYSEYGQEEIIDIDYRENPIVKKWAEDLKIADNAFVPVSIPQKEMISWDKYRLDLGYKSDPKMLTAKALHYYSYSTGLGALSISTWQMLSEANIRVLERFRNLFNLAYRRYSDISRAEAQAREAQIEAALERVRAKAMSMHSSDDLTNTVKTFFSELESLNITPHRCGMGIINKESRVVEVQAGIINENTDIEIISGKLKLGGHAVLDNIFENWLSQKEYHPVLKGKEIKEYYRIMNPQVSFPDFADDKIQYGYYFFFKEGGVYTWTDTELEEGELEIFRRYNSVLSLTYRRYIDLVEAESQAREAQIETSLEKVRSRTMAMHRSEEMPEVANNLFLQVQELGIPAWSAGYCIWEKDITSAACSMSSEGLIQKSFSLPTIGVGYDFSTPHKNGEKFYVAELGGRELIEHYEFMRKLPVVGEILDGIMKEGIELPTFQIFHIVYFPYGYLMFITYEEVPKAHDI